MNHDEPTSQPFDEIQGKPEPDSDFVSARARRRRAQRRAYFPSDEAGRAALYEHLARRAFPSYELFVFSLIAGVFLGLGYFLNAQALLIFGILVAPVLTSWIGISLSVISGSGRLFTQTITALFVSSLLIFGSGLLAGFASRVLPNTARTFTEAFIHSRLWGPDLFVLTAGAIIITISFVRSEERPYLPSALLAYELLLPLCAAGFGLGSGVSDIWPQGALVFAVHFVWATFFGILTLFFLRFYPISIGGATFTGLSIIAILTTVTFLTGFDQWIKIRTGRATPEPASVTQASPTRTPPSPAVTESPKPLQSTAIIGVPTRTPSRTLTPTPRATLRSTETPTNTVTAEPTPILAIIRASEGGGALIREKPGGKVLEILPNGSVVIIVPNDIQDVNGVIWVHIIATVNGVRIDGWIIQSVLVTATPIVNWQPSPTSEFTATP